MQPVRERVSGLDGQRERHHQVTDDQNDEIGGRVIGAVMMQVLVTGRTRVRYLQKRAKQMALTTVWATPAPPAQQGAPDIAGRGVVVGDHFLSLARECTLLFDLRPCSILPPPA